MIYLIMENVKTNDNESVVTISGVNNDAKIAIPSENKKDVTIN